MLLSRTAGMGAYPGDSYFDPGRPSWLPFWIDTPTESALKYGLYPGVTQAQVTGAAYPNPPAPAPPAAPGSADQVATWTPGQAIAQADAATKQQNLDFFSSLAPTLAPSNSGIGSMWLYVAIGVGVLALVLLMRGR